MTDINPISNEDDLRAQAQANTPRQPQPEIVIPSAQESIAPTPQTYPSAPNVSRIESHQHPEVSVNIENEGKPFSYRIPAFGYFLTWMFLIAAVILGAMASANISTLNATSEYAAKYSSAYGSAYSSSIQNPDYFKLLMPIFIAIVYCIIMVIGLLRGGRLFRYVGIVLSIGAVGYEIYKLVQWLNPLLNTYSKYSSSMSIGSMLNTYFAAFAVYIPYALLPLIAGIYLLTPKANKAYK